jgi:hypothetical protein
LTTAFGWRAIFWFLTIFAGASCLSFLLFRDTYHKERSLLYQKALKARLKHLSTSTITEDRKTSAGNGDSTSVDSEKGEGNRKEQSRHNSVDLTQVNLSLRDLNPFRPIWFGLRRLNNLTILFASGKITSFFEHVKKAKGVAQDSYSDSVT